MSSQDYTVWQITTRHGDEIAVHVDDHRVMTIVAPKKEVRLDFKESRAMRDFINRYLLD
jgi:pheromone shutdown protein TraB